MTKLICIFIFYTSCSYAFWSPESREFIEQTAKKKQFSAPVGFVSLWSGVKRKWESDELKGELRQYFAKKYLKNDTLSVYFSSVSKKAPLTIFFPGIFGDENSDLVKYMIYQLEKTNRTHVAVIPNFFSKSYIKARPIYRDDTTDTDLNVAISVLRKVYLSIGKKNITHINLVGESLGSFVAAGSLSLIENKLLFKDKHLNLVMLWPPLQLNKVMLNFDEKILNASKIFRNCEFWYRYLQVFYHFVWQDIPKGASEEFVKCMDSYLYHGVFVDAIQESLRFKLELDGKKLKKTVFTFKQFIREFNPQFYMMLKSHSEKLHLDYWLKQRDIQKTTVRIISSRDDFINKKLSWDKFLNDSLLTSKNLILLNWGGHCGGLALPIWDEVLYNEIINIK